MYDGELSLVEDENVKKNNDEVWWSYEKLGEI